MCSRRWELNGLLGSFWLTFITGDPSMDKRWGGSETSLILPLLLLLWGALGHSRRATIKQNTFNSLVSYNILMLTVSLSMQCYVLTINEHDLVRPSTLYLLAHSLCFYLNFIVPCDSKAAEQLNQLQPGNVTPNTDQHSKVKHALVVNLIGSTCFQPTCVYNHPPILGCPPLVNRCF